MRCDVVFHPPMARFMKHPEFIGVEKLMPQMKVHSDLTSHKTLRASLSNSDRDSILV
jgi:hypothetical protein